MGSLVEVDVDAAGERVRDDERRRSEEIRARVGADATLEVAVAAEHAHGDEASVRDRLADGLGERTAVADAGRAAVADDVELEPFEGFEQARFREVLR